MRIFVAGASGVIGRRLVPLLTQHGHVVTGMTRSAERAETIRSLGAEPVACDAFDTAGLESALRRSRPEVVINQLTSIPSRLDPRRIAVDMAATNRLRDEGTAALVKAARAVGARRIISQSIAFAYRPDGAALAVETDPLYTDAPAAFRSLILAVDACERATFAAGSPDGVVLRYGYFYGPGTVYAADGTFADDVRRRRIPIIGGGQGVFSFVHVDDAARATLLAVETTVPAAYNIVDDEPAAAGDWLPHYASLLGARRPLRIPAVVGRLGAGAYGMYLLTEQRGAANGAARTRLGWRPRYPTWREGFAAMLTPARPA